ncbi:hypothetical protein BUALT_Bualt14G0104800 [Buddleja alternifolia]|uniref:Uncharacterized protein n=1 Tax=Buddleja alternifolia TaxID=168488 RepID=A0AAV6WRY1_9LAMI|nr:hypothetical protein BUALT_Bualt14G0104800 [Buddleja alternifolia]
MLVVAVATGDGSVVDGGDRDRFVGADRRGYGGGHGKSKWLWRWAWQIKVAMAVGMTYLNFRDLMAWGREVYIEELKNNPDIGRDDTLRNFVQSRGYTKLSQKVFLVLDCPQWQTPKGNSQNYVNRGAVNFLGMDNDKGCITYWLNAVQNISEMGFPLLLTLDPPYTSENTLVKWSISYPIILSVASSKALLELNVIQGKRRVWFRGAYQGYCFHDDGLKVLL